MALEAPGTGRPPRLITVVVDDAMIPLDRVLGAVRRRNMPLVALSVGPGPIAGTVRVFADLTADEGDIDRLVRQLRKLVGVHHASERSVEAADVRQLALVRVTPPGSRRAALVRIIEAHRMVVLAEQPLALVLEVAGSPGQLERGLQALAPFGILDVARSSPVAFEEEGATAPAFIPSNQQDDRS